ncbi:MAG: ABC transporter ATP-binding protein [Azonexus sp.]
MNRLELSHVVQRYGKHTAVDGVGFRLAAGRIACLLGPSGCGKTSLLRSIAGFEHIVAGEIRLHGECVAAPGFSLAPEKRRIGMVFQDYALFPHLSVARNIAFGLNRRQGEANARRVDELLATVGLSGQGEKYPHQLSGGQQQRVALARALAPRPELILLDEPFSNLDVDMRERLSLEVRVILKREGSTALMDTHDQHDAVGLADEIGVMQHGRIAHWDTPERLYRHPANRFVAAFIGRGTLLPATVDAEGRLQCAFGPLTPSQPLSMAAGSAVELLVRPDDIAADPASALRATVVQRAFRGTAILYTLRLPDGSEIPARLPATQDYRTGETPGIRINLETPIVFPAGGFKQIG